MNLGAMKEDIEILRASGWSEAVIASLVDDLAKATQRQLSDRE